MACSNLSKRAMLVVYGYIREGSRILMKDKSISDDVMNMCWKFFFIPFNSAILKKDKDLNDFLELISEKIAMKRLEHATLLYKGTRDHKGLNKLPYDKLTDQGPYLFVIESTDGYLFGGYCTVNIRKEDAGEYLKDENAFLWVLRGEKVDEPTIYLIKAGGKAAVYHSSGHYWWIFGPSGADLVLYPQMEADHYCCENGDSGTFLKYSIPGGKTLLGTSKRHHFRMTELEIFSIPFQSESLMISD